MNNQFLILLFTVDTNLQNFLKAFEQGHTMYLKI